MSNHTLRDHGSMHGLVRIATIKAQSTNNRDVMMKKSKNKHKKLEKIKRWKRGHPRTFLAILAVLLLLLLAWWIWWREPMGRALGSLLGHPTTASTKKSPSTFQKLATIDSGDSTTNATPASGGGTSTNTRTSTGGTTGTSNGGSTSTTTNTYNNTTNNGTTPGNDTPTPSAQNKLISAYAGIGNGMSQSQLVGLGIGEPDNCLVSIVLLGKQQVCTWNEGSATVIATLINDQVVAKAKVGF